MTFWNQIRSLSVSLSVPLSKWSFTLLSHSWDSRNLKRRATTTRRELSFREISWKLFSIGMIEQEQNERFLFLLFMLPLTKYVSYSFSLLFSTAAPLHLKMDGREEIADSINAKHVKYIKHWWRGWLWHFFPVSRSSSIASVILASESLVHFISFVVVRLLCDRRSREDGAFLCLFLFSSPFTFLFRFRLVFTLKCRGKWMCTIKMREKDAE